MTTQDRVEGSWGIEPVSERLRILGTLDTSLLGATVPSFLVIFVRASVVAILSQRAAERPAPV